jgi:hypothetical protein
MPSIARKNSCAFTLVELCLVTAMLAVISLTVFATFNNAVKIVSKVRQEIPEEDIYIFLDRFTADVNNSLAFSGLAFKGSEDSLELITLVQSPRMGIRSVGKVLYSYDEKTGTLDRELLDFSHLYSREKGYLTHPLTKIKSFKFYYSSFDPVKKESRWEEEWLEGKLPTAIRLEFEVGDEAATTKCTKTVTLPVSS